MPWVSLIIAFLFGLVFLLPFPSWHSLVGLVTSASVLMYAGAPLSLGAFRRQVPEADRPYRMPGATVLVAGRVRRRQPDHLLVGLRDLWKLGIVLVIGYILIGISMAFDKQRPPLDWKSAQWLPVYLIGMGIISWQGQFSGGAVRRRQHRPHPVLVGHGDRRRVQPGHLLLGAWPPGCPGKRCWTWSTGRPDRVASSHDRPRRARRRRPA